MKKKVAIVFGITANYDFALANVLIGMKKHCKIFWDDIIVFHDNIPTETQERLNKILPCAFRKIDLTKFRSKANLESIKAYSYLAMARFECFSMLEDYEYVIWHDVDILIQKDFNELLHSVDKTGLALTYDENFCVEQNFWKIDEVGYDLLKPLYNSGIMVLRDTLKHYNQLTNYCYEQYNKYGEKLRYLDQAILNMMIQDYDFEVGYISLEEYCCHPSRKEYQNAKIIHAYGSDKFWNSDERMIQFPEWQENNRIWEKKYCNEVVEEKRLTAKVCVIFYLDGIDIKKQLSVLKSLRFQTVNFELHIVVEREEIQEQVAREIALDEETFVHKNIEKCELQKTLVNILRESQAKYAIIIDSETYSMPKRFQKQIEYFEHNKKVDIVGGFLGENGELKDKPVESDKIKSFSLLEKPIFAQTAMFKKEVLEQLLTLKMKYDSYVFWNYVVENYDVQNIPEKMVISQFTNDTWQQRTVRPETDHMKEVSDIIKRQFMIDTGYDDVVLLLYPEIIYKCYHTSFFQKKRNKIVNNIFDANKKCGKYDQVELEKLLYGEKNAQTNNEFNRERQIKDIMRNAQGKKIALWGTGRRCIRYIMEYPKFNIDVCIDNDIAKNGTQLQNINVIHPSMVEKWEEYYIIITPVKHEEIKQQLEKKGLKYVIDFAYGEDIF